MISRRSTLSCLLCAPAIIRTAGLLVPVRASSEFYTWPSPSPDVVYLGLNPKDMSYLWHYVVMGIKDLEAFYPHSKTIANPKCP